MCLHVCYGQESGRDKLGARPFESGSGKHFLLKSNRLILVFVDCVAPRCLDW